MSSRGIIDLRPQARRKPPEGQQSLFVPRSPLPPRKPLPLRARRRRVRALIALLILLALAGLAYGVHYISYLPQFSIQSVTVVGTKDVAPQLIRDYVQTVLDDGSFHFLSSKNVLLYPGGAIEKAVVEYFPRIASVTVSRPSFAATELTVTVTERSEFALWCEDPVRCYQMDEGGFIFAELPAASTTSQYVFHGGVATTTSPVGQRFVAAHLPALVALLIGLGQSGFTPLGATVENDTDFSVPLERGYFLKASFGANADTLVKNLQLVLSSDALRGKESQLDYVDLRFGDRVYYKLKGEAEVTPSQ